MRSWESGPGMIQEPELEEGEACYYKDDASINPDIALSYIGDKVQSLLGHHQKDFEGEFSAENLGAKFGGYGSFLPMHQRSPSIWLQPKSPHRVQNPSVPRSPNNLLPEVYGQNTSISDSYGGLKRDAPSTLRNGSASPPSMCPSKNMKVSSEDASIRQKASLSYDKVAEVFPGKTELPSSKSGNPTEHRTLKFRIKMGSDRMAQYNAEIYNLGLTSPSSSMGNSPEESSRLKIESHETPDESPANILQIMTSFLVSGGSPLSPLCEDLLNLCRETESSAESECKATPKRSSFSFRILSKNGQRGKKTKCVDKTENLEKSENEWIPDLNDYKQKIFGSETLECRLHPNHDLSSRPLSDTVCSASESLKEAAMPPDNIRDSEKNVPLKKRKGSKDRTKGRSISSNLVEDASLHRTPRQSCGKYDQRDSRCSSGQKIGEHPGRVSQNDISVQHEQDSRSRCNPNRSSDKSYPDISEGERVKVALDKSSLKVGLIAKSGEQDNLVLPLDANNLSFDRKSKESQRSAKLSSKLADSLRDGGCTALQDKDSGKKESHQVHLSKKDTIDTSLENVDNPKHLLERPSCGRSKNSNLDTAKEKPAYANKLKDRSSNKKYSDKMTSETFLMEPPAEAIHFNKGIISGTEQIMTIQEVIQENWVGCDRCEKWRLLPYGTQSKQLPDKWVCSMLDWLPGMNRCDVSEDETSAAVRASYAVPVPDNQYAIQAHADRSISGVSSAGAHNFPPNHQQFASDQLAYQVKRQKFKERLDTVVTSDPVPSCNDKKNFQQPSMKKKNLREVNQPVAGVKAIKKCNIQHPNKSVTNEAKLNKRKDEHVIGDVHMRKKIKKESFQHVPGKVKKIKSKGSLKVDPSQVSGGNLDRTGHNLNSILPNKEALKDEKKPRIQKDASSWERGNFPIQVKQQKEEMQDLAVDGSLKTKTSNKRDISAKKRKFKDCEDRQQQVEGLQNNVSSLQEQKVSMKEDIKGTDFCRDKKSTVSQIEEFKRNKDGDISKIKAAETRVLLLGRNENPTNRDTDDEQQARGLKVKLLLTKADIDELRKDLDGEHCSTAATSSSSKISDSHRNRISYMEVKGSPEESVSSSPVRMPYLNQVLSMTTETAGKVGSRFNDVPATGNVKRFLDVNGSSELGITRKGKADGLESFESPVLGIRGSDAMKKPCGKHVSCGNHRSDCVDSSLVDNKCRILEQHGPCPTSILVVNCSHGNEGMRNEHSNTLLPQQNSRKNSSLWSMGKNRTLGNDYDRVAEKVVNPAIASEVLDLKEKMKEEMDVDGTDCAPQYEVIRKVKHPFSDESSIKAIQHNINVDMRDLGKWCDSGSENQSTQRVHDRNDVKYSTPCSTYSVQLNLNQDFVGSSVEKISTQMEPWNEKFHTDMHEGVKQGALCPSKSASGSLKSLKKTSIDSGRLDVSVVGDISKALKDPTMACHQNGTLNFIGHDEAEGSVALEASSVTKNVSSLNASIALKEAQDALKKAEELKTHANLIKNSGFFPESNYEYLKAALKFLHGASLLEAYNGESVKHFEMDPMQIYGTAAKLCETCAYEYEKSCELAAAALAYKCLEVVYLRMVYCKSSSAYRIWRDLQASLQMVPQGESPSSSASDVDNLNNLVVADRVTLSKGNDSHAVNHVILPRNRVNLVHLLDFTKDVNFAMEAAKKSQDTFASAHIKLEESQNKEGIVSVKRVIDFSFHDVEELMNSVLFAFNAINCQVPSCTKE